MLRLSACALALSAIAVPAAAQSLEVSTNVGFESRYLFRGIQFAETSFQPAINLGYGGFYLNAWLNLPIGDDDFIVTPGGEELDLIGGYSFPLSDVVSVDVGFTYYTFPDLASGFFDVLEEDGDGLGANTFEPFIGLAFDIPLSPSIYLYHDLFGGFGADRFDFSALEGGSDQVYGFDGFDSLGYADFGYADQAEALTHFTEVGMDLLFSDQGVDIFFHNTTLATIQNADFYLS